MSIATSSPPVAEQRFLLSDVSWSLSEHLLEELGDRPIRVTFDRGSLELMSPSYRHDRPSRVSGLLLQVLAEEMELSLLSAGSTTFRREDLARGLEADECFYIEHVPQILGKEEIDLTIDPPPDLAIEIEVSRNAVDRMSIYEALGVPELWRYRDDQLHVFRLQRSGAYAQVDESPTFPGVPPEKFAEFLKRGMEMDDISLQRAFRNWVRTEVLPRMERS